MRAKAGQKDTGSPLTLGARQRLGSAATSSHIKLPATRGGLRRFSLRWRPARPTRRLRPDFGLGREHYVNRLSHFAQDAREGWAK